MSENASKTLRDFIRANGKADGALDALDALRELESAAADTVGTVAREAAYSAAIVKAQETIRDAYKNTKIDLGGKGGYAVAETEQLLQLCREAMAPLGLAVEVGNAEMVMIGNTPFARIGFGLRHRDGYVHRVTRDFPIADRGEKDKVWRGANTSALGYFLRDAFALPRLKDEGEAAQAAAARSGPRRAATFAREPSAPPAEAQAAQRPAPSGDPKASEHTERLAAVLSGIAAARTLEAVEKSQEKVDGFRYALSQGESCPWTSQDLDAMGTACSRRRTALESA